MEVLMLGRPAILDGDARHVPRPGKTSAVLYLAAFRGEWVDREELLAMFWPDFEESRARANLRQVLNVVRNQPFTVRPEIEDTRIRWRVSTDVAVFRTLEGHDDAAAVRTYRGPLLDGFRVPDAPGFEDWLATEREAMHRAFRRCVLRVGGALSARGRPSDAAELYARLLQHDPFDEAVVREHMVALQTAHGVSEALGFYADFAEALAEEVGLEPEPATSKLAEEIRSPETATLAQNSGPTRDPLPRPPTRFVGRVRELAHVCAKLTQTDVRFVDLTGPGGIGKTRLAIEAARHVQDAFPGGAAFIPLARIARSDEVHDRIAATLRITPSDQRSTLEAIADSIGATDTLLVLDNLESIDGVGEPISELIQAAPTLTLLGTSRAVLGVEGEVVVPLQGLDLPDRTARLEDVSPGPHNSDAVTLFLEAAARNLPTYDPGPAELAGIARVCRATGGMPLAIELAAQWVRVMPTAELADEIERDLTRLARRHAHEEARHGSVRALFDRSWVRLDDRHQRAIVALSVFRGPFTSADAGHVAGMEPEDVLELVDRSLLEALGEGRLDQHPLIRAYVRERSEEHPRIVAEARRAHAELYATRLAPWSDRVFGPGDREALHALDPLIEDARAAWRFAVETQRWDWLAAMLPALNRYHDTRRIRAPLLELVADALRVIPHHEPLWQPLVQIQVCRLYGEGRYTEAIAASDRVMDEMRERGEGWRLASVMCWTGAAYAILRQTETAARIWREALEVPGVSERPRVEGRLIANLSFVTTDADEADQLLARGVRKARQEGSTLALNWMLRNQSIHLLRTYGRYSDSERIAREAVEKAREFSEGNVVTALQNLAYVQLMGGWLDRAETAIREADAFVPGLHEPRRTAARIENLHLHAHLLADRGKAGAALELCHDSLAASQANVHRLLLARLNLATGHGREASLMAAALAKSAERQDGIRGRIYMRIMVDLLAADAARLQDDETSARSLTADALALADEHTFLPAALYGLVVAASILDPQDRRKFSAMARQHPASSHETRMRARQTPKGNEANVDDLEDYDGDVNEILRAAIDMLRS